MKGNLDLADYRRLIVEATDLEELERTLKSEGVELKGMSLENLLRFVWILSNEYDIRRICETPASEIELRPEFEPTMVKRDGAEYRIYKIAHGTMYFNDSARIRQNISDVISRMGPSEDFLFEENFEKFLMPPEHRKLYRSRSFNDHYEGHSSWGYIVDELFTCFPLGLFKIYYWVKQELGQREEKATAKDFLRAYKADDEERKEIEARILQRMKAGCGEKKEDYLFTDQERESITEVLFLRLKQEAYSVLNAKEHAKLELILDYTELPAPIGFVISHRNCKNKGEYQRMTVLKALEHGAIPFSRLRTPVERSQYMADHAVDYAKKHGLKVVHCFVGSIHAKEMVYFLEHPEFRLKS